jgi:hypothetical protein
MTLIRPRCFPEYVNVGGVNIYAFNTSSEITNGESTYYIDQLTTAHPSYRNPATGGCTALGARHSRLRHR